MASGTYDWNKKATQYTIVKESGSEANEIVCELDSCPSDKAAQDKFATQHSLTHGDVVDFETFRQSGISIAIYDEATGKYSFVKNPDDAGAGYLTIPAEVLLNVDDATVKYEDVFKDLPCGNMHLSHKDAFLKGIFKVDIPDQYTFDLLYQWGDKEELYISKKGCKNSQAFDMTKTSWDEVVAFFDGANQ